jgi:hypothetical protein
MPLVLRSEPQYWDFDHEMDRYPQFLDPVAILALLDQFNTEIITIGRTIGEDHASLLARYGETSMNSANNKITTVNNVNERFFPQQRTVAPASGSQGCSCGAPNGGCMFEGQQFATKFCLRPW